MTGAGIGIGRVAACAKIGLRSAASGVGQENVSSIVLLRQQNKPATL